MSANKENKYKLFFMMSVIILFLAMSLIVLHSSCALQSPFDPGSYDFTPPTIVIHGAEDGGIYLLTSIYIDEESGVEYTTLVNNMSYKQHDTINRNGYHEFKVTARKLSNGLTKSEKIRFNIDNLVSITDIFPADNSTGVNRNSDLLLVFNKDLSASQMGEVTLYEEGSQTTFQNGINCTMIISNHMLTIDPFMELVPAYCYSIIGLDGFKTESGIDIAFNDTKYDFLTSGNIVVISPDGGETYDQGAMCSILWSSDLNGTVNIELLKSGVVDQVIVSGTDNDGSYNWSIPAGQAVSGAYAIRITSVESNHLSDTSDGTFSIVAPDSIIVTSPNGGETVLAGSLMSVTWTSNIGGNVLLQLYKGGIFNAPVIASTVDDGLYTWTVPGGQTEGNDYTIRIEALGNSKEDYSDNPFSIEDPNKGYFTGTVVDSANNTAIDGAQIQIFNQSDVLLDTVLTDMSGQFQTAAFSFGDYKIVVSKTGYTSYSNNLVTISQQGENNLGVIPLTIDLPAGELKFFLKWIDEPGDLDFHLTGPTNANLSSIESGPAQRYHIWFGSSKLRYDEARDQYTTDDTYTTRLEYDDTGQDRFETLYFKTGAVNGLLTLSIHNYSKNVWYKDGGPLPVVQVFIGRDAPYPDTIQDITFPSNANHDGNISGHFWKVCQVETDPVNGHVVTVVNELATWAWESYSDKLTMDWGSGGVGITLRMNKDVGIGNAIFFSGSGTALTNWGTGIQGIWTTGNTWEVMIADPGNFEWKVRKGVSGGAGDIWETGSNHNQSNLYPGFNGGF